MHRAASSSRSVADRFNSYNTCFCSETDPLTLGPLLSGRYRLYHRPMSTVCFLYTLGGKPLISGSTNTCLLFFYSMHFNIIPDFLLTMYNFVSMCLAPHLTRCHRSKLLKWLSLLSTIIKTPGTGSFNHFVCPSASYHAIPCLCITLMLIVLFWRFSTQKLQV